MDMRVFRVVGREHKSTYVSSDGEYQLLVLPACALWYSKASSTAFSTIQETGIT